MEYINCNICGKDESEILFFKKDKYLITEDDFRIVKCKYCGLIYINPRPSEEEIHKYYPSTYSWRENLPATTRFSKWIRHLEKWYRDHLLKSEIIKLIKTIGGKRGKLLDVGCGSGDRLNLLKNYGFDAQGIEPSLSSVKYAREHFNLNVENGDLCKNHYIDSFFDIITFYNVIEHTHYPRNVIREAYQILKDNGIIVIQVPNSESLQFKLFNKRWAALNVPRDLYYFNVKTFSDLLEQIGFKIFKTDHFSNWWHPPTIVISMFPGLDPQLTWAEEKKMGNPIIKRMFWAFWTLCAPLFVFFESMLGRGAIITIYAKKA